MGTVSARRLIETWAFRLRMHRDDGPLKKWSPSLQRAVEELLERLRALDPEEPIDLDADEHRDPIAIFLLARTGEVLGQIARANDGGDVHTAEED